MISEPILGSLRFLGFAKVDEAEILENVALGHFAIFFEQLAERVVGIAIGQVSCGNSIKNPSTRFSNTNDDATFPTILTRRAKNGQKIKRTYE